MRRRYRCRFGVSTVSGDRVVVTGGEVSMGQNTVASCEIYTLETKRWHDAAQMHHKRYCHAQVTLDNGTVLVCGGAVDNKESVLASVEIYLPKTNTWTEAAPMPEAKWNHKAVVANDGTVVVAGGFTQKFGGLSSNRLFLYDPKNDVWTAVCVYDCWSIERVLAGSTNDTVSVIIDKGGQLSVNYKKGVCRYTSDKASVLMQGPNGDLVRRSSSVQYVTNGQIRKFYTVYDTKDTHYINGVFFDSGLFIIIDESPQLKGDPPIILVSDQTVLKWSRARHINMNAGQRRKVAAIILSLFRAGFDSIEMVEGVIGELRASEFG